MIETIPFDLMLAATLGLALAYVAFDALAREGLGVSLQLCAEVLLFHLLVFCPVGAYLYATEPAWSWNYLVDPGGPSGWLGWVGVGAYALVGTLGACAGALLARHGGRRVLLGLIGAGLLAQALFFAFFARSFWWVGTFDAWRAGPGAGGLTPIVQARLAWALGAIVPVFAGVYLWLLLRWRRFARRVRLGPSEAEMKAKS